MNSKMIAIIAVVAMCGAALVGVGYAYTASYESSQNGVANSSYVTISPDTPATVTNNITMAPMFDTYQIANGTNAGKYVKLSSPSSLSGSAATTVQYQYSAANTVAITVAGSGVTANVSSAKCIVTYALGYNESSFYDGKIYMVYDDGVNKTKVTSGSEITINLTSNKGSINFYLAYETSTLESDVGGSNYHKISTDYLTGDSLNQTISYTLVFSATQDAS